MCEKEAPLSPTMLTYRVINPVSSTNFADLQKNSALSAWKSWMENLDYVNLKRAF